MKKNMKMVALSLLCVAAMTSCSTSEFPGYKATENGLYYKLITKGDGEQVMMDDIIGIELSYYANDSMLYHTNMLSQPAYDKVQPSLFPGDLYEAFQLMHVGDSMSFMINADSVFMKQFHVPELPEFIAPGSYLRWEVKVNSAMTEDEFFAKREEEAAELQRKSEEAFAAFLAENNITEAPQESGIVYVCTTPGNGKKPVAEQKVKVHYTGKLLDGTVFDSSVERGEPFEFTLGAHQVIPGWDEGIALMSKGEKGILYLPSSMAYGPQQAGPVIAPYSNLIFEVELIDFE